MAGSLKDVPFEDFIQSDLFTFHVGEEKKTFVVHSKAVAATSPVFDALVNGGLSEAQARSAELVDTDPDTFIRFLEYTYRRDYTTPSWTQDPAVNPGVSVSLPEEVQVEMPDEATPAAEEAYEDATVEPLPVEYAWSQSSWSNPNSAPSAFSAYPSTRVTKKLIKNQMGSRTAFDQRRYLKSNTDPSSLLRQHFEPQSNTSRTQNFVSVFLAHARLYTLAAMRLVDPLRELTLHKLHKTLVGFKLYPERLSDVVELARYAYEHGEDRSEDGRIDALRDLVVNYIACEMKVLGKHTEFRNLMDGGGEFAGDFWDIVSQKLL